MLRMCVISSSAAFISGFKSIRSRLNCSSVEFNGFEKLIGHTSDGSVHIVDSFSACHQFVFSKQPYCDKGTKSSTLKNYSASRICYSFWKRIPFVRIRISLVNNFGNEKKQLNKRVLSS